MKYLPKIFDANREWADRQKSRDPDYFERLCAIQRPDYLWVGCADSRVPANTIVGLAPGEVFVHRNIANLVREDDRNGLSVLQYGVDVLQISHVMVVGHYHCGGVKAACGPTLSQPLESWLSPIRSLAEERRDELEAIEDEGKRWDRLCELNVIRQVEILRGLPTVIDAWERGQQLDVHGWIYDLRDGLLRDLDVSVNTRV